MARVDEVWKVVSEVTCLDYTFEISPGENDIVYLRLSYDEADIHTGKNETQRTRRWVIEPEDSRTKIIETCWAAVQRSMQHRAGEGFKYKGFRVYSPHFDIAARTQLCREGSFDCE